MRTEQQDTGRRRGNRRDGRAGVKTRAASAALTWVLCLAMASPLVAEIPWLAARQSPVAATPVLRGQSLPLLAWLHRGSAAPAEESQQTQQSAGPSDQQPAPAPSPAGATVPEPLPAGAYCSSCFNGCGPPVGNTATWYVMAELMPLKRDNRRTRDFASLGAGGPIVLSTANLDEDFEAGARVLLGRAINEYYRAELSWFGAYVWSDQAAVRNRDANALGGTGNLFSPFSNFGVPAAIDGLDYNELTAIRFSSKLNNVELNLRRRIDLPCQPINSSFLVGLRYMKLQEQFRYSTVANVPAPSGAFNDVLIDTDNDMLGAQIGLLMQFWIHQRSWVDFEIKGGIFTDAADLQTHYVNTDNNGVVTTYQQQAQEDTTSFMGDLSLMFNYQLTPAWTFRVGYNAMWLTGVALGADNFQSNIDLLRLGPAQLNRRGRVVYHGPSMGLIWAW